MKAAFAGAGGTAEGLATAGGLAGREGESPRQGCAMPKERELPAGRGGNSVSPGKELGAPRDAP